MRTRIVVAKIIIEDVANTFNLLPVAQLEERVTVVCRAIIPGHQYHQGIDSISVGASCCFFLPTVVAMQLTLSRNINAFSTRERWTTRNS